MIKVPFLAINKDGFLRMRGVEFILFGAYLIEMSPNLKL
jgi:hypothetical protein